MGHLAPLQVFAIFSLVGRLPAVVIGRLRVKTFAALVGTESIIALRGNAPAFLTHLAKPDLAKIAGFGQSDKGYHRIFRAVGATYETPRLQNGLANRYLKPSFVLVGNHSKKPTAA